MIALDFNSSYAATYRVSRKKHDEASDRFKSMPVHSETESDER